ncbi:MAG: ATP-binding protein [Myxococcota bacterium]
MSSAPQRLRDLVAVNRAIVSTLDYDEVLHLVVDKTRELTRADACALLLRNGTNGVRVAASRGIDRDAAERFRSPLDEHIHVALREMLGYREEDTFIGVPIIHRGRIQGLLVVYRRGPDQPDPEEEFLVSALADQAAIALEHARLYGEVTRVSAHQARLLETIQSNTSTYLAYLDRDLRFVEANAAYCAVSGRRREDLVGRAYADVFPDAKVTSALQEVRETGEAAELPELRVATTRKGSTEDLWWNWSARPIRSPEGDVEGVVLSAVDVTEEVRARAELEATARRKDEFLAMLAHELRNPLAAISSAVEILRSSFEEGDEDPAVRERVRQTAGRQIDHMRRLLDDLLDVSRITRGAVNLKWETLRLESIVGQAIEATTPLVRSRNHQVSVRPSGDPVYVHGDPDRLVQVVSNLLSNAAKYTSPGGHIEVTTRRRGESAEVHVRDNGIGIAPDVLPHVFDTFVQADRGLDRTEGGLGIGLTVVERLVQMHGGDVEARSEGHDQGSEFIVRLPALKSASDEESPHSACREATTEGRRILVVEDNQDAADLLALLLKRRGHDVTVAGDGPTALEISARLKPDVVLLDIGLPGMDGYELARHLRRQSMQPRPRLVALSGYGGDAERERAERAGLDGFLTKPVNGEQLNEMLNV